MAHWSDRRRYLGQCGGVLGLALAGCLGRGRDDPGKSRNGSDGSGTRSATDELPDDSPVVWERSVGSAPTRPAVGGDRVYVGTRDGDVVALGASDGTRRWTERTAERIRGQPVVDDGAVLVVSGASANGAHHAVVAIDAASGDRRWTFRPEQWWLDVLAVGDGLLYVGTADDAVAGRGQTLYAVATDTGEVAWSAEIGDARGGLLADDAIYVPTHGRLYAYDATDGTRRWETDLRRYGARTIAATPETVCYVGRHDGTTRALVGRDTQTGELAWAHTDWRPSSTTLRDGVLYVGGERTAAFDPATGETQWTREQGEFLPRGPVRDGTVYAGGAALRALDVDTGTATWSWTPDRDVEIVVPAGATDRAVFLDAVRDDDPRNRETYAINRNSGDRRWVFGGRGDLTGLVPGGDAGYVGAEAGSVYRLATGD